MSEAKNSPQIDLDTRLALGVKEAAAALGVSEKAVREMRSELPAVSFGRRVLYPVRELREWLSRRVEEEQSAIDRVTKEVLDDLELSPPELVEAEVPAEGVVEVVRHGGPRAVPGSARARRAAPRSVRLGSGLSTRA